MILLYDTKYLFHIHSVDADAFMHSVLNRMVWQWAETLVEIRVTLADIRGTTK